MTEAAEQAVVAALLKGTASYGEAERILKPQMFVSPVMGTIYRAIAKLGRSGEVVNCGTVALSLGESLEGGQGYLSDLTREYVETLPLDFYARDVRSAWVRREIGRVGFVAQELIKDSTGDVEVMLDELEGQLLTIRAGTGIRQSTQWAKDLYEEVFERLDAHLEDPKKIAGYHTGWPELDLFIDGIQPKLVHVLAAEVSVGKSLLVHNLSSYLGGHGIKTLICSTEMPGESVYRRMAYMRAGVDKVARRRGMGYTSGDKNAIRDAVVEIKEWPVGFCEYTSLPRIIGEGRRLARSEGLQVYMVDHLDDVAVPGLDGAQAVDEKMQALKALAMETGLAVVAVSQLSRTTEFNKGNKLSRLRGGGGKEQKADVAIFIEPVQEDGSPFRDDRNGTARDKARSFLKSNGWVKLRAAVEKQRDGQTGDVFLRLSWDLGGQITSKERTG